ncbi:C2H2 type zinc finger domain protein [Aspergillus japonicus CBS 114.51]|uniref:C2H2 type zinc finger domain protein n=2 Tax=Aspergillus TaxID=5052 RepID=A0A2V5GXZ2_ASPV1|nr:C2H2 type zinc finger domain protein [Aspergillus japonicus CBS 114.51]PYI14182.1 C2H2 type zinc finger domain protein [Aspergillus violaceofuscus CBS 115571]RAH83335.1 C2H2 type zinc finger domain protein [Aspergillus japonicus CBS 114.51]
MASQETLRDSGQSSANGRNRSPSPAHSPQPYNDPSSGLTLDVSVATTTQFPAFTNVSQPDSYGYNPAAYLSAQTLAPASQNFSQTLQLPQHFNPSLVHQLDQSTGLSMRQQQLQQLPSEENFSTLLNSNPADFDFALYQNPSPNSTAAPEYDSPLMLDPRGQSQLANHGVNPADLISQIPSTHRSSSPQLSPVSPQDYHQHSSPGPMSPPTSTPGTFYTPQHSRHTSLDPATAAYMSGNSHQDWQAVMGNSAFQGHRRAPSEVSEVSSAAPSPYMSQHESFDGFDNNPSPLLAPQNDPGLYENALGIESFTLSEHQQPHSQPALSPAHSPYISPQLMPQQGADMIPNVPYISAPALNSQYPTPPTDMYTDSLSAQGNTSLGDMGQASQMAPPSINVEFAPPFQNSNQPQSKPAADLDSLSPPVAIRSRMRSKSDPYAHPASRARSSSTSASLEPFNVSSPRSLSPFDSVGRQPQSNPSSREPSPSRSGRRLSTSSIDSRNYILGLADPQRPGANLNDSKRVQKHPATFQCHLCPKRFTRAYNLRSHLRTHTDERPFVCTVCGKAFARQHDRKRHEGLHSGEKKFVCRGELSRGGQWGCGRRFARADALGRHFRSEAGRICIKPLLDEESQDRERSAMDQQQQHLQPMPPPLMVPGMDGQPTGAFVLPAALLAQYPALQTLQWDQIPATADDPSDIGGRSSFDASSGGEFGFEDDESGLSTVSGIGGGYTGGAGIYDMNSQGHMLGINPGETSYQETDWRT